MSLTQVRLTDVLPARNGEPVLGAGMRGSDGGAGPSSRDKRKDQMSKDSADSDCKE